MLAIAEHKACIGSFYTRLRFCYYDKKICYSKEILTYLFRCSYIRTVNIALVLASLNFFVNLHFAKFKFVKQISDDIKSNPIPDHSKHYNRSVLYGKYQGGVKFSETAAFQCIYNSFFAICFP